MIKYILVYYTKSKYFGMVKQHIEIFNNMEEMIKFREKVRYLYSYEIYKQVV